MGVSHHDVLFVLDGLVYGRYYINYISKEDYSESLYTSRVAKYAISFAKLYDASISSSSMAACQNIAHEEWKWHHSQSVFRPKVDPDSVL